MPQVSDSPQQSNGSRQSDGSPRPRRITSRGKATRDRIVSTANQLTLAKGVANTTFEEIKAASGVSKSQLYFHFPDKEALVQAVVRARAARVIAREEGQLGRLNSIRGLERWRDALVQTNAANGSQFGCGIGALASELADQDDDVREVLQETFLRWQVLIREGLERMRDDGKLTRDADPEKLATGLLAALQGGYILAQTAQDSGPMKDALDMAIDHVKTFAAKPAAPTRKRTKSR